MYFHKIQFIAMAIPIVAVLVSMISVNNEPAQARFNACDNGDDDVCVKGGDGQKGGGGGGQFAVGTEPFTVLEKGGSGHQGGGHFEFDENSGATKCVGKFYKDRC